TVDRRNMDYSPSERSTWCPPLGRSPERIAWSAALTPRLMVWPRFMRCAHAGGLSEEADAPPAVGDGRPPRITARSPEAKLSCMLAAARRSGLIATEPAACATPAAPPAR